MLILHFIVFTKSYRKPEKILRSLLSTCLIHRCVNYYGLQLCNSVVEEQILHVGSPYSQSKTLHFGELFIVAPHFCSCGGRYMRAYPSLVQ